MPFITSFSLVALTQSISAAAASVFAPGIAAIAAQLVMVPAAWIVGTKADQWGRKPLLLAGFLILPLRGVLYTLSDDPYWLVAIQMLDGVGAGLFGALFPLVVKDLTHGTGRFNVSLGALSTVFGFGAALSNSLAGLVVQQAGYSAAFLTLAAIASVAFVLLWWAMPETLRQSDRSSTVDLSASGVAR